MKRHITPTGFACGLAALMGITAASAAPGSVTFTDIAAGDDAGITYRRTRSPSDAVWDAIKEQPFFVPAEDLPLVPLKSRGAPGVALLDYDGDGDLDIYVTNGPGTANSLYASQLQETGAIGFADVGVAAGVAATDQDSTGVCYGDTDNDGDHDLLVLGNLEPNRLFENHGDGTFSDISTASGVGAGSASSMSCSMGDIDGDGLLDIAIANNFDMREQFAIFVEPFAYNQPNQLLRNQGGNSFVDVSESSGFRETAGFVPALPPGQITISWAIAMVDFDQDGDIDIMQSDDQGALPTAPLGGQTRGMLQLFENDGTGWFTNVTAQRGLTSPGAWMGLSYGDFDSNGLLDVFGSNAGNHVILLLFQDPAILDAMNFASRYFLQQPDGTMIDGVDLQPDLHAPFCWGTSAEDYDNDGDTDVLCHGGLDQGLVVVTSPAVMLDNDGNGHFTRNTTAFADSTDHLRRVVEGMATGDLDNDGFVDVVSVSSHNLFGAPTVPGPTLGSPFDVDSEFILNFVPANPEGTVQTPTGIELPHDGTLSVELSNADNGNRSVQAELRGTIGITSQGQVNRDGIGAVITFTPKRGKPVIKPVISGSSYASQNSLVTTVGLGREKHGTIDVLWPGGVRNRLDRVKAGSRVLFPEIPCSYDDPSLGRRAYRACVTTALDELVDSDVLSRKQRGRFLSSAMAAYRDAH